MDPKISLRNASCPVTSSRRNTPKLYTSLIADATPDVPTLVVENCDQIGILMRQKEKERATFHNDEQNSNQKKFKFYSGSWKTLTLDARDGPASSIFSSSFETPASATLALKSSSTRTLAVLKFLCTMGGFRPCKWHKPALIVYQSSNTT